MKEKTCLALFSGGLDSMLAVLYMEKLGFNVIPVNFNIGVFFKKYIKEDGKLKYAKKMPFKNAVEVIDISSDFLKMLKAPPHGFGKHMNPCIDCKILMLKKAKEIMEKYNAGFVITGEVLGQRPMSQNPSAAKKIRDESGLEGFLVRPLCAKAMEPTEPEKLGWIDRESLLGITGRGRKQQIEMAKEFGIDKDIETPGGGCLLTEGQYAKRLKDFMTHNKDKELNEKDMFILSAGRHFRKGNIKFIIGRNKEDNEKLRKISEGGYVFRAADIPGPEAVVFESISENDKKFIASVLARYTKLKNEKEVTVKILSPDGGEEKLSVAPITEKNAEQYRIDA